MGRSSTRTISVPRLADEYELEALRRADRNSSVQDIVRSVRQSGVLEAEDGLDEDDEDGSVDRGGEHAERIGNDLASEVEARARACGLKSHAYPFRVEANYIAKVSSKLPPAEPYTFMLLLTLF